MPRARKPTPITLSEQAGIRYLHFGSQWIQGAMRKSKPADLVLEYTRQMMAWSLFVQKPKRIVQLGLGAGALTRFCLEHYASSPVTVVELDEGVVNINHSMFALPQLHASRLQIHVQDAQDWVADEAHHGSAHVLMVDLYDALAQGPTCESVAFYEHCRAVLRSTRVGGGVLCVNLFGNHPSFARNLSRMSEVFENRVICLPEIDEGNTVVLAFTGPLIEYTWPQLFERAVQVQDHCKLPARKWVTALKAVVPQGGVRAPGVDMSFAGFRL